jgi:hypothetical protein
MLENENINSDMESLIEDIFDKYMDLLEKIDLDTLSDEAIEHLEYILDLMNMEDLEEELDERRKVRVVRKGKVKRRLPKREGYKVVGNRYVRMKPTERKKRSRSAKRGARKARTKSASRRRQMKKSLKIRKGRSL